MRTPRLILMVVVMTAGACLIVLSQKIYAQEVRNSDVVVVNNVGNLNFKMKNVKVGDYVRVVYEGQDIMQKGAFKGKPVNIFDVLVA